MADKKLGFWDYVKAAFHLKYRMGPLGHIPINKILLWGFGILGIGHPGFWFLGLAYEIGFLTFLPGNERFQKMVRGQMQLDEIRKWTTKQYQLLSSLDKPLQDRYSRLYGSCMKILQDSAMNTGKTALLRSGDVNQLLWIVLKLLTSRQRLVSLTNTKLESELRQEISVIERQLEKEASDSPVSRSIKATLDIQRRRLENLSKAQETLRFVDAELERIEKQVQLMSEETAIHSDPQNITIRLDGVLDSLEGTTVWMREHAEIFGDEGWDAPVLTPRETGLKE